MPTATNRTPTNCMRRDAAAGGISRPTAPQGSLASSPPANRLPASPMQPSVAARHGTDLFFGAGEGTVPPFDSCRLPFPVTQRIRSLHRNSPAFCLYDQPAATEVTITD